MYRSSQRPYRSTWKVGGGKSGIKDSWLISKERSTSRKAITSAHMRGPNKQCGGSSSGMSLIVDYSTEIFIWKLQIECLNPLSIGKEHIVEQENALEIQDRKMRRGSSDHV